MKKRKKEIAMHVIILVLMGMVLQAETLPEIIWVYGRQRNDLRASIYNARAHKSYTNLVRKESHDDYLSCRGSFKTARSLNSYMSVSAEAKHDIDLKAAPVLEIRLKCSVIEKPLTLVWSKNYEGGKDWNYQLVYPLKCNEWETFLVRLDQPHRRKLRMTRLDSLAIQKNYEGNRDDMEISVSYIKFRPPCDGDVYVDGNRPLVRLPAAFKARSVNETVFRQFKFGVWGSSLGGMQLGIIDPFYCDDDDVIAGRFRANYLNSFMYPTTVWPGWKKDRVREKERIEPRFSGSLAAVLRRQVASCHKYQMTMAPLTQFVPRIGTFDAKLFEREFLPLVQEFKDASEIFGWYLTDEPDLEFMTTYNQVYPLIEKIAPSQVPFVNLCNRYSAYRFTGDIAGMLVTDSYPIGRPTPYRKGKNAGLRNPWLIIDWVMEMEEFSEGKPHYLILSTHSFFDASFPTDPELRLQVYLALAHGADSLFFFIPGYAPFWLSKYIDQTLLDPYGNPSPVWKTIGDLGRRLIPIGGFLAGAQNDTGMKVSFSQPNPKVKVCIGERPVMEAVVRQKGNRRFIILWNNSLHRHSQNRIGLDGLPSGMELFDLELGEETDGTVALAPGDGRILLVTSKRDFQYVAREREAIRLENERMRIQFQIDMMEASVPQVSAFRPLLKKAETLAQVLDLDGQLTRLTEEAEGVMALKAQWEDVRSAMGAIHRILSENIEAPQVIMYQYGQFPVSAVTRPGKDYVRQMLQMSLAFREIERGIRRQGLTAQQDRIVLMKGLSEQFLSIVKEEFKAHKPNVFSGLSEAELLKIVGHEKWNHYKNFLEKP